jgi:hypothetical protein
VSIEEGDGPLLQATVMLDGGDDADLAALYDPMLRRETNRRRGVAVDVPESTAEALRAAAAREGAQVCLMLSRDDVNRAADILAAADRIRYLTPRLHREMFSELRFPEDASQESGIDVRSLELEPADLVKLDILRRQEVMAYLAQWDAGAALGEGTREHVRASAGLCVVSVPGRTLTDYARGGSAVEAVWIVAQQRGLAVQPVSPVFLYAHNDDERHDLSPEFAASLRTLQSEFRTLTHTKENESQVLVLRFSEAPPPTVRSRRRSLGRVGSPLASQSALE